MSTPSFDVCPADSSLIRKIATRAKSLSAKLGTLPVDSLSLSMDLTACHANGCPLRLEDLLAADDFNFAHDVFGISNSLDRTTGKLPVHFLPRFAR